MAILLILLKLSIHYLPCVRNLKEIALIPITFCLSLAFWMKTAKFNVVSCIFSAVCLWKPHIFHWKIIAAMFSEF